MAKWIAVMKVGEHPDSKGRPQNFTEQRLDNIVAKYDPAKHEAPEVIGHPKDNSPAWGWVKGLKREGDILFYESKGRVQEFQDMLDRGLFKKRSLSLYPDDTLRHIGYLGAQPPAVKGLPDPASFAEGEAVTIEFSEAYALNTVGYIFQRLRDWIIEKYDQATADRIVDSYDIEALKRVVEDETPISEASPAFSEPTKEDLALTKELEEKLRTKEREAADFAEQAKSSGEEIARLKKELADKDALARRTEHASFCERLMKQGRVSPAMKLAVLDFMEVLSGIETFDFAEADEAGVEKRASAKPVERFKTLLTGLPVQIEFAEKATNDKAADGAKDRDKLIADFQEANRDVTYKDAVLAVSKEHPELFTNQ